MFRGADRQAKTANLNKFNHAVSIVDRFSRFVQPEMAGRFETGCITSDKTNNNKWEATKEEKKKLVHA